MPAACACGSGKRSAVASFVAVSLFAVLVVVTPASCHRSSPLSPRPVGLTNGLRHQRGAAAAGTASSGSEGEEDEGAGRLIKRYMAADEGGAAVLAAAAAPESTGAPPLSSTAAEHAGQSWQLVLNKIACLIVMAGIAASGVATPYYAQQTRRLQACIPYINCFACGAFLGLAFFHLLPEALETTQSANVGFTVGKSWFNLTFLLAFIGFMGILSAERVFLTSAVAKKHAGLAGCCSHFENAELNAAAAEARARTRSHPAKSRMSEFAIDQGEHDIYAANPLAPPPSSSLAVRTASCDSHHHHKLSHGFDYSAGAEDVSLASHSGYRLPTATHGNDDAAHHFSLSATPPPICERETICCPEGEHEHSGGQPCLSRAAMACESEDGGVGSKGVAGTPATHHHGHHDDYNSTTLTGPSSRVATLFSAAALLTTLSLSIHSIFEGIVVGMFEDVASAWIAAISIIGHKWAAGVALGANCIAKGLPWKTAAPYLGFFCIASPLGIIIGMLVISGANHVVVGVLDALSLGTILYVGCDLTFHEFGKSMRFRTELYKLLTAICGAGVVFALMMLHIGVGHHHGKH